MNSFPKCFRLAGALATSMTVCILSSVSASAAGITLSAASVSAAAGSSANAFDVDLTNLGTSAFAVGGFSFGLSIANVNISFTGVTSSTMDNYIFAGNSLFGPDLSGPNSGQNILASDVVLTPFSGTTIAPGETIGLGHVFFNVSANATAGMFAVNFASLPSTSLSDPLGNNISLDTLSPGQITIAAPAAAVPEPSYLFPLLSLTAFAMLYRRRPTGPNVLNRQTRTT